MLSAHGEILVKLLCCCFFCFVLDTCKVDAHLVRYGYQLRGHSFRKMLRLSLKQCHEECVSRKTCKSYNYIRSVQLCELNNGDMTDAPDNAIEYPNSVYSQKSDWDYPAARPECSSCRDHEVCRRLEDGTFGCFVQECQRPPPGISNAIKFGNERQIAAKLRYVCTDGAVTLGKRGVQCDNTGNWSLPEFTCVPAKCWTPNTDSKYEIINVTTDSSSAKMYFRCIGNYITRGSPLTCGSLGYYDYQIACCDEPDQGQWVKIFNVKTGGDVDALLFWEQRDYKKIGDDNTFSNCQFRRFDIINNWSYLNISKVKIKILVNDTVNAWVVYDGHNSTNEDWFSKDRLIETSWQDLSPTVSTFAFGIIGFFRDPVLSRFSIVESYSVDNCSQVSGWMMLAVVYPCLGSELYPNILFAPESTKASTLEEFQLADSMEFLVEFAN